MNRRERLLAELREARDRAMGETAGEAERLALEGAIRAWDRYQEDLARISAAGKILHDNGQSVWRMGAA